MTDAEVTNGVERQLNAWIQAVGSREKLEEYRGQSITAIREGLRTDYRNQLLIQEERKKIVGDIAVTPADVRRYFEKLPADSLPYVPTEVEVQILMQHPKIPQEEINRVKDRLRETDKTVSEIAYEVGFQYPHHLSRLFKKVTGVTPNEYRAQS